MYVGSKPQSRKADTTTGFFLSLLFYPAWKICYAKQVGSAMSRFASHKGMEKFSGFQVIREGDAIPVARLEQMELPELELWPG